MAFLHGLHGQELSVKQRTTVLQSAALFVSAGTSCSRS
jgi:hypothetical protein